MHAVYAYIIPYACMNVYTHYMYTNTHTHEHIHAHTHTNIYGVTGDVLISHRLPPPERD